MPDGLEFIQMLRETWSARSGSAGTGDPAPSVRSARTGILRKEGDRWTVGWCGKSFLLEHTNIRKRG